MAKSIFSLIFKGKDQTKGTFASIKKNAGQAAVAVAAVTAAAGVAFLVGAISSSGRFEEQMQKVRAVSGAVGVEFDALKKKAEEMGATTRFTATEAAEGLEELIRSGQDATESIATLPSALFLAQGASIELADAARLVTTTLNQYGLEAAEAGRVSDVFTVATQNSAQNMEQLQNAMEFAGPTARSLGVTLEETTALLGKLADAGFRGEKGGTALRNALLELKDPASKFSKTLLDLGITSTNFVDVLTDLENQTGSSEQAFLDLGKRAGPAIEALVRSGGFQELADDLLDVQGAAEKTAATMDDSLAGATKGLESAFDALQRELADPILDPLTDGAQDLADVLRSLVAGGDVESLGESIGSIASFVIDGTTAIIAFTAALFGMNQQFDKTELGIVSNKLAKAKKEFKTAAFELGRLMALSEEGSFAFKHYSDMLDKSAAAVFKLRKRVKELSKTQDDNKKSIVGLTGSTDDASDAVETLTGNTDRLINKLSDEDVQLIALARAVGEGTLSVEAYNIAIGNMRGLTEDVTEAMSGEDFAVKALADAVVLGTLSVEDYLKAINNMSLGLDDQCESLDETVECFDHVGEAGENSAKQIESAFDSLFKFLPDGFRQAAQGLTSGFAALGSGASNFLFGPALAPGQAGPPAPGAFGGLFGSGGVASDLFNGAIGGAGIGGAIGGSNGAILGAIGGAIGSIIPGIGTAIGSAIGSVLGGLLGGLFGGGGPGNSQLIFGTDSINNRNRPGPGDQRRNSSLGDVLLRGGGSAFRDEFQGPALQALTATLDAIASVLSPEEIAGAIAALGGSSFTVRPEDVADGRFLLPVIDRILGTLDERVQGLVAPFDGVEDKLNALQAAQGFTAALDINALDLYNQAVLEAGRTQQQVLLDQVSSVEEFLGAFDGSIAQMQEGAGLLQAVNRSIVQVLAGIDSASLNISAITENTIGNLRFQTLDDDGKFDFLTRRAEQLASEISGLGSADEVQRQIQLINQLVNQAAGIASPEQLAELLPNFEKFLTTSEAAGQARLEELREQTIAINESLQDAAQQFSDSIATMGQVVHDGVVVGINDSNLVPAATQMKAASQEMGVAANKINQPIEIRLSIDRTTGAITLTG